MGGSPVGVGAGSVIKIVYMELAEWALVAPPPPPPDHELHTEPDVDTGVSLTSQVDVTVRFSEKICDGLIYLLRNKSAMCVQGMYFQDILELTFSVGFTAFLRLAPKPSKR